MTNLKFSCILSVREHPDAGVYIDKLSKNIITDGSEAKSLLEKAIKRRLS